MASMPAGNCTYPCGKGASAGSRYRSGGNAGVSAPGALLKSGGTKAAPSHGPRDAFGTSTIPAVTKPMARLPKADGMFHRSAAVYLRTSGRKVLPGITIFLISLRYSQLPQDASKHYKAGVG